LEIKPSVQVSLKIFRIDRLVAAVFEAYRPSDSSYFYNNSSSVIFPPSRINFVDFGKFLVELALGKFAVSGVETVMNELALVPIACIINLALHVAVKVFADSAKYIRA
jgi:hypothetical protein